MIKLSGISIRIWTPFALSITLFILAAGFYYPQKQANIFYQNSNSKIRELAKTVALGVELALNADNYEGLKKTIDFATTSSEFEFIALVENSQIKEHVFMVNPDTVDKQLVLKKNVDKFLYESYPVSSELLNGYVLIAVSKENIKAKVFALNLPVYVFLTFMLLLSLILFLFLADSISKPIRNLKNVANLLEKDNYDVSIEKMVGTDEISNLNNALLSLRDTLKEAKRRNDEFNKELESQIILRTKDLKSAQEQLIKAQKTAKMGVFEFNSETSSWTLSDDLYQLLQIEKGKAKGAWLNNFTKETQHEIKSIFLSKTFDTVLQYDLKLTYKDIKKPDKWINMVGEFRTNEGETHYAVYGTMQDITQRKVYEEEINRLSLVATKTSNSVIITDANKQILWVNDALLKLTGYSRQEVIGNTPKMFQFHKTSEKTIEYIRESILLKKEINTEILNVGKNGNEYWLDLNIVPLFDKNDKHTGYIAVENDITERKRFEQEILSIKNRLESIINEINDVVWSANIANFETIFITPSGEQLYGFSNSKWKDSPELWKEIICEEDQYIIDEITSSLKTKESFDVNYRIIMPDKTVKWVHNRGRIIKNSDGESLRIDGMVSDVTEALASVERQKQFIKEAPSAIAMLDNQLNYIAYSDKWIEDYNLGSKQILGKSHYEVFPQLPKKWKPILEGCLNGNTYAHDEVKFKLDASNYIWLKWRMKPWYSDVNVIGGIIMMTEDVTHFKESKEEELRNILKLTQSQNQRLKNFAHIVSHNLRSHSGNIQSLLSLMHEDFPKVMQDEIPVMLTDSSDNLAETIAHLSEVAAMNFNENIQFQKVHIKDVIENAIQNVAALALSSEVEIINKVPDTMYLNGLIAYFDSIFLNFLTNGIKYRSDERPSHIWIDCIDKGQFVQINIEDNGVGIDMKRHGSKLFGMYKTFHKNEDSRGIGLFITKNQIEAMGGRVEAQSEVGRGTCFSILFKKTEQESLNA